MKSTYIIHCYLVLLFTSTICIDKSWSQNESWTVMIYLDGDNNLEEAGLEDVNEMEVAGSSDSLHIIVQFDRIEEYSDLEGDWTSTKRFRILQDARTDSISSPELDDLGELNMGDPETLSDFITWAATEYPADHYALILWNHGGGWDKDENTGNLPDKDVCYDDTDSDYLSNYEVKTAIVESGIYLDIIAYDACLMGMIEIAYEVRDLAGYMVASEETIPWNGYDYTTFLSPLAANTSMNAETLTGVMVDAYGESYSYEDVTLSSVDLSKIRDLKRQTDTLVQKIIEAGNVWDTVGEAWRNATKFYYPDYVDLGDFARILMNNIQKPSVRQAASDLYDSIQSTVVYNYTTSYFEDAEGTSIYFPEEDYFYFSYEQPDAGRDFADSSLWNEFLHLFYENYDPDYSPCYCDGLTTITTVTGSFTDGSGGNLTGNDCYCSWLIQPEGATSITLTISELYLEDCCDYLTVYDGMEVGADNMIDEFSGEVILETVTSSIGSMYIEFTTDGSYQSGGWSAIYTSNISVDPDGLEELSENSWSLFPNPGDGNIHLVNATSADKATTITIFTNTGHQVYTGNAVSDSYIDISTYPAGIYHIKLTDNNHTEMIRYVRE